MDEEADASDDAEHDEGEVIDGESEVDLEAGNRDPWLTDDAEALWGACGIEGDPEPGDKDGGDGGADESNGGDKDARKLTAKDSVGEEAGEGKQRDQPEIRSGHQYFSNLKV